MAGRFEVVETLSGVLVPQVIDALEFQDDLIFDDQVGQVLSNASALVFDGIQNLGLGADSLKRQFFEEKWVAGALGIAALGASRPKGVLIDSHVHLFDPKRVPYHRSATYQPPAATLESYIQFVKEARIDHTIIVHPEPYQDDHRYLEYCFEHEPSRGFFKGACLFDPVAPDTPARMQALVKKLPTRIVALRIHENLTAGKPPATSGPIRDRDMRDPAMKETWRAAHSLGLAIQMHFIPRFAPKIGELAAQFRDTPVILDHLARSSSWLNTRAST